MTTKVINIKDYRQNLTKIWKESQNKKQRLIVMSHSRPIFEVKPIFQDHLEFDFCGMDSSDQYKMTEKSFSFWKDSSNDNLFDENISL